jgi:hypothetical protein
VPVRGIQSGSYSVDSAHRRARYRVYVTERRGGERPVLVDEVLRTWHPESRVFVAEHPVAAASPQAPLP